mmetsp:Transcript_61695/g.84848  ORF Transcript_61695/g.84848 Transcript_61695/m.84848 type:complete len:129 (-) Transcript_61695:95-481(-)
MADDPDVLQGGYLTFDDIRGHSGNKFWNISEWSEGASDEGQRQACARAASALGGGCECKFDRCSYFGAHFSATKGEDSAASVRHVIGRHGSPPALETPPTLHWMGVTGRCRVGAGSLYNDVYQPRAIF